MNRFAIRVVIGCFLTLILSTQFPPELAAQTNSRQRAATKEVECPPFVAIDKDSVYYQSRSRGQPSPVKCFKSKRDATSSGFASARAAESSSLTGWWRVAVRGQESTCPAEQLPSADVNLFLQMRETPDAVFGEICPTTLRYVGKRLRGGVTLVGSKILSGDPLCGGTPTEATYTLDFSAFTGPKANDASFSVVKRCTNTSTTCRILYRGEAFRETKHEFFPEVPTDLNNFAPTCSFTLSKCADCH